MVFDTNVGKVSGKKGKWENISPRLSLRFIHIRLIISEDLCASNIEIIYKS